MKSHFAAFAALFCFVVVSAPAHAVNADPQCEQNSFVQEQLAQIQIVPTGVVCLGKACYYTPNKGGSVNSIKAELPKVVFGESKLILAQSNGFIETSKRSSSELSFWHPCEDVLELMKRYVVQLDQPVLPTNRKEARIEVRIYHMTEAAYNNMSVGMSGIFKGAVPNDPAKGTLGTADGVSQLNLAFGNLTNYLLNLKIGWARNNNSVQVIKDFSFRIHDGDDINRNLTKNIYVNADTNFSSSPPAEEAGYRLSGDVQVIKEGGAQFVSIRDLSILYGVPQKDDPRSIVEILNASVQEAILMPGVPYILHQEDQKSQGYGRQNNLPAYYERTRFSETSKLIIFVSATVLNSEVATQEPNLVDELKAEQVEALPTGGTSAVVDALKSAQFRVQNWTQNYDSSSLDLVLFQLDASRLNKENFNQKVEIEISGPGLSKQAKEVFEVQHLALNAFQFPSVMTGDSQSEFKVRLRPLTKSKNVKPVTYKIVHYKKMKKIELLSVE